MFFLTYSLILYLAILSSAIQVNVSLNAPSGAVGVSPSLVSFSLEQDRWIDWAGTTAKNTFFYNALQNLINKTGEPPWIRIGGDSEDHTDFSYSVKASSIKLLWPSSYTLWIVLSNKVSAIFEHCAIPRSNEYHSWGCLLPNCISSSSRYISNCVSGVGLTLNRHTHNLGCQSKTSKYNTKVLLYSIPVRTKISQGNLTAAYLETKSIVKAFKSSTVKAANITLDFLQIGNEPDLYFTHGARQLPWGPTQYVQESDFYLFR